MKKREGDKMPKVGIGITSYGVEGIKLTKQLLEGIKSKTKFDEEFALLVLDDGTQDKSVVDELARIAWIYDAEFEHHESNEGIPKSWNDCVRILHDRFGCEELVILNNDLLALHEDWLKALIYFLRNNEDIGTVGLSTVNIDPKTGRILHYNTNSFGLSRVGSAIGCDFAIKYDTWRKVKNEDGSIGWFSGLRSFHEEIILGFRLAELGYLSAMLPYPGPSFAHFGGATFAASPELIKMKLPKSDKIGVDINPDEYKGVITKSKIYPEDWKKDRTIWEESDELYVDRMSFTRYIFCKIFNVDFEHYDNPTPIVHERIVTPIPPRKVKYLDKNGKEKEAMI